MKMIKEMKANGKKYPQTAGAYMMTKEDQEACIAKDIIG